MLSPFSQSNCTKWLYIPMEVQVREMTAKLLLACVAAQNGYSCILGEVSRLNKELAEFPKGIVYLHACGSGDQREKLFNMISAAGQKIAVCDDETVSIYNSSMEFWLKSRISNSLFEKIDQYHVWGQRQAEIIEEHLQCGLDRFHVTGSYRVDVWKPPVCEIHRKVADEIRAKYGPYILLSSNFTMKFDLRGGEYHLQLARDYNEVTTEADEKRYRDMIAHKNAVGDKFVEALPQISQAFPNHTIIVRPHPTEGVKLWQEAIGGHPKIRAIYEGDASPWLLGADAIFHNGCTNALEARMMGKIPLTYRPIANSDHDESFLFSMGPMADDLPTLIHNLQSVVSGKSEALIQENKLDEYVFSPRNELSCDRIVAEFAKLDIAEEPYQFKFENYVHALRQKLHSSKLDYFSRSKRRARNKNAPPPKWPGIHLSEAKKLLTGFQTQTGRFKDVEIIDFKRRLFLVRPKN